MEENKIPINKYMFFDTDTGRFHLTSEAQEIIYRRKGIICSYSGSDEWLHHFTCEMIDFYTGASKYNYALGAIVHEKELPEFHKRNKDGLIEWVKHSLNKEWGKHMYEMIKDIIDDVPRISN